MQQDAAQSAKQLIVERVRQSTNILVAVSTNPSVDALSAALGLTLILNKLDKHATAVFSGNMPPAMQFLEPTKTFENTVDSLRDFIISLDKEKADRLRYKVENDVVKIFITPYRTTITEKDLQFSQGDFNVELIIALGVEKREELDKAIVAHGRILHDATVVTVNANNQKSSLGAVDWHDPNASSLCEMLVSISEAFQQPGILDAQTSTALLTGIVAATERFSNQHTTPRVMTMAAQLMAAGANQQLIATNLRAAHEIPDVGGPNLPPAAGQPPVQPKKKDGELDITHDKKAAGKKEQKPEEPIEAPKSAEEELAAALPTTAAASQAFDQLKNAIEQETTQAKQPAEKLEEPPVTPGSQVVDTTEEGKPQDQGYVTSQSSWRGRRLEPPTLGGTLNATAEQALRDEQAAAERDRNQMLLNHEDEAEGGAPQAAQPPTLPTPEPPAAPLAEEPAAPPATEPSALPPVEPTPPEAAPLSVEPTPAPEPALGELQQQAQMSAAEAAAAAQPVEQVASDLDTAREAVTDALHAQPFEPGNNPLASVGAQPMPETPQPQQPPAFEAQPAAAPPAPEALPPAPADTGLPPSPPDLPPLPPMPPLPQDDGTLPPPPNIPDMPPPPPLPESDLDQPAPPADQPQRPADPGQFKIPGQQ
ncbi:MAG: DHH family phosphoesterase [Candidatus Saccharimonadales bacterium]